MRCIRFTKMVATGNDFVVIDNRDYKLSNLTTLAKKLCNRKLSIGADGLLVAEKSKKASIRMRIFNPDGSEPEMCGNGARCLALFSYNNGVKKNRFKIQTRSGIIVAEIAKSNNLTKIKMTGPKNFKCNIPVKINKRRLNINFINTGVPHVIVIVSNLDNLDIISIGRKIRYHKRFMPKGTNVNFIEILNKNTIKMRTYERGVEDETLACGTGAVASAIITDYKLSMLDVGRPTSRRNTKVITKGGILKIYFNRRKNYIDDVWLEGEAMIVYTGRCYV